MKLPFIKCHGLGNDYIYLDLFSITAPPEKTLPELARCMSRRKFNVGADGLVLFGPDSTADAFMRIFNADGSEALSCGNALRCISRLMWEKNRSCTKFSIRTPGGIVSVRIFLNNGIFQSAEINMGAPRWNRIDLPMTGEGSTLNVPISIHDTTMIGHCVSVGNPHCIIFLDDLSNETIRKFGPAIETYPLFPHRINAGFCKILTREQIQLIVWERGSGLTEACGTGATAAFAVGRKLGLTNRHCTVTMPGGSLTFSENDNHEILMTGPAEIVYSGSYRQE